MHESTVAINPNPPGSVSAPALQFKVTAKRNLPVLPPVRPSLWSGFYFPNSSRKHWEWEGWVCIEQYAWRSLLPLLWTEKSRFSFYSRLKTDCLSTPAQLTCVPTSNRKNVFHLFHKQRFSWWGLCWSTQCSVNWQEAGSQEWLNIHELEPAEKQLQGSMPGKEEDQKPGMYKCSENLSNVSEPQMFQVYCEASSLQDCAFVFCSEPLCHMLRNLLSTQICLENELSHGLHPKQLFNLRNVLKVWPPSSYGF